MRDNRQFFIQTGFLSLGVASLLFYVHSFQIFDPYRTFSFLGLLIMIVFNVIAYLIGKLMLESRNKMAFVHFVLTSIFVKVLVILLFVFSYVKLVLPESKLFILPFIGTYLVFTISETFFLYKMAVSKTD